MRILELNLRALDWSKNKKENIYLMTKFQWEYYDILSALESRLKGKNTK